MSKRKRKPGLRSLIIVLIVSILLAGSSIAALLMSNFSAYPGAKTPPQLVADLEQAIREKDLVTLMTVTAPSERSEAGVVGTFYKEVMKAENQNPNWSLTTTFRLLRAGSNLLNTIEINKDQFSLKVEQLSDQLARIKVQGKIQIKIEKPTQFLTAWQQVAENLRIPTQILTGAGGGGTVGSSEIKKVSQLEKQLNQTLQKLCQENLTHGLIAVKEGGYWYLSTLMTWFENSQLGSKSVGSQPANYQATWENPTPTGDNVQIVQKNLVTALNSALKKQDLSLPELTHFFPSGFRRLLAVYGRSHFTALADQTRLFGVLPDFSASSLLGSDSLTPLSGPNRANLLRPEQNPNPPGGSEINTWQEVHYPSLDSSNSPTIQVTETAYGKVTPVGGWQLIGTTVRVEIFPQSIKISARTGKAEQETYWSEKYRSKEKMKPLGLVWRTSPQGLTLSVPGTRLLWLENCQVSNKEIKSTLLKRYQHPVLVKLMACPW